MKVNVLSRLEIKSGGPSEHTFYEVWDDKQRKDYLENIQVQNFQIKIKRKKNKANLQIKLKNQKRFVEFLQKIQRINRL